MAELPDFLCVPSIGLFFKFLFFFFKPLIRKVLFVVFFKNKFIYLLLAVLGLHCSVQQWRAGASWVAQLVKKKKIHLQCRTPRFDSWVRKIHWRRDRLPTPVFLGFPGGSAGKESVCKTGDLGLIPWLEDPLEEVMATHASILAWRISRDRGAWRATVHGVAKSQTWLNK